LVDRWDEPEVTVVTGAAGWLGRALVASLAEPGGQHHRPGRVRVLVHHDADRAMLDRHAGLEVVVGSVTNAATVDRLFDGVPDGADLVHAAGLIHPRRVAELTEVNVRGTSTVVAAAARHGVRRLVHVSSNSPFGTNPRPSDTFRANEPYHPYLGYGRTKMLAEEEVWRAVDDGLDAVVVRPPWFYGPYQPARQTTFFKLVQAGRFPVPGDGSQRRSMVYVENLVDGIVAAELTPGARGKGYWVADEQPYELDEIVATVGRALAAEGLPVKPGGPRHLPAIAARVAELADRMLQRVGLYQQQLHVLGELGHTIACDISAARQDLGYEPAVALEEGMRRSIRWCLAEGLLP
jgi:nucleoside-diphosphate-sugar epimerase